MLIKKIFYKFTNKKKYEQIKKNISIDKKIKIFKTDFGKNIRKIQETIKNQKQISFLHSGHLGDVINALPVVKELSKNHDCNLYLQSNKPLEKHVLGYKHPKDDIYMSDKMVNMVLPLLKSQSYIKNVKKYNNERIDINFDLFRNMPMDFNLDEVRWYFHLTGVHADLSVPYLNVKANDKIKNRVVVMRSTRRKNLLINYKFMNKYKDIIFIGLNDEYQDLKKEVTNLEFYECKDFLEAAEIIKSSKFFLVDKKWGRHTKSYLVDPVVHVCPHDPTCILNHFLNMKC